MGEEPYPYRAATLKDRGGDVKKRWYIEYYLWDVQKGSLVRQHWYADINQYASKRDRIARAITCVNKINELLKKGRHIDRTKDKQKTIATATTGLSMPKAIEYAFSVKKAKLGDHSYESYKSVVNHFLDYIAIMGFDLMPAMVWKKKDSIFYLDYLITEKNLSGVTVNKYKDYLKAIFTILEDRELVVENPWKEITKEKEIKTNQNAAFSETELKTLLKALKYADTELLAFAQVMFYTFMRPKEIRLTQIKNTLLVDRKILVPAGVSKNRVRGFVDIPEQLIDVLAPLARKKSPNEFLFQRISMKPYGKNTLWNRHHQILEDLGMADTHTLYSWKHTGVVMAYKNGVDIKSIQLQCRHHSISQTDEYLKSLGLYENKEIKFGMPNLPL